MSGGGEMLAEAEVVVPLGLAQPQRAGVPLVLIATSIPIGGVVLWLLMLEGETNGTSGRLLKVGPVLMFLAEWLSTLAYSHCNTCSVTAALDNLLVLQEEAKSLMSPMMTSGGLLMVCHVHLLSLLRAQFT